MGDWKSEIQQAVAQKEYRQQRRVADTQQQEQAIEQFYASIVLPAFEEFQIELIPEGRQVEIKKRDKRFSLIVVHDGEEEMDFELDIEISHSGPIWPGYKSLVPFSPSQRGYEAYHNFMIEKRTKQMVQVSKEDVLQALAHEYTRRLSVLSMQRDDDV